MANKYKIIVSILMILFLIIIDNGSVKSFSQIGLQASGKMKSVGNGGILNGSLQMLHIHVLFVTPLGTSHMA